MHEQQRYDSLDKFRILAAALVVAIHTSPLTSISVDADFFLTRVLARIAVPFFFMVTGQFVASVFPNGGVVRAVSYVKKIALLYGLAIVLYLPIGIYAGQYEKLNLSDVLRMLVFDGTFYHLWYFPACIAGVLLVYAMSRFLSKRLMLAAAAVLYGIGLFGDSYYGLIENVPVVSDIYEAGFQVFSYTRNGIFMAPVFLVLGVQAGRRRVTDRRILWAGLCVSFVAMTEEAFLLRHFEMQRHDSMYILLLPVMFFLYQILLNAGISHSRQRESSTNTAGAFLRKHLGTISTWIYILHPAMIVAVRGAAKALKLNLLTENSLVHYLAVLISSAAAAVFVSLMKEFLQPWILALTASLLPAGASRNRQKRERRGQVRYQNQQNRPGIQEKEFCSGRAWLELDRNALRQNVEALRSRLPETCKLMPAVKADAYGHGAVLIAKELQKMGVRSFCVACIQEGIELRRQGIKGMILILGYTHPKQFPLLCSCHLTQTVIDYTYALQLNAYGKKIHVHIGVDTGMHRIGERSENLDQITAIYQMEHLVVDGLFTHLCTSDTKKLRDQKYTASQAEAFQKLISRLKAQGYPCPKVHMQASYGVLNYPKLAGDYARVGIALYGVLSTKEDTEKWQEELHPVLSLKARIAAVKTLYKGESAGYGIQFTAKEDMRIATLAVGYADGLPRALSGGVGSVLINGQKAPVIGRICMDQMMVDLRGIENVQAGDVAVLIGRSGNMEISVCDMAQQAGTITNEILSRMGARLERMVV